MEAYEVASNACNLQVYTAGNKTSKVAILCLHGGPGSGAKAIMELPAFQALAKSYLCVYFDQRGSGNSFYDITKGIRLEDITQDVFVVLQDMKERYDFTHILLWGGSFGGCLAALCMKQFPEEFDGFILSSPAITFSRQEALAFFKRMQAPYQKRFTRGILSIDTSLLPEDLFKNEELRSFIYSSMNPSNSLQHICAMSTWFFLQDFHHLFQTVQRPVLVLQGKDDPICRYENIERELSLGEAENVCYILYENCGHAVFEDKEEEFVKEINRFIMEVSGC